jgi:hypothetical protein
MRWPCVLNEAPQRHVDDIWVSESSDLTDMLAESG